MRLFGEAMLMTFTEVPPEDDADFSQWYNHEHLDERINLPGFRRARRYQAVNAAIRYVSTYEALKIDAIASPVYLELLKRQTDWSQRIIKKFIKWHRISGRVMVDLTHGVGGSMVMVRLPVAATEASRLSAWLTNEALPAVNRGAAVLGSCAVATDAEADDRLTRGLGQTPVPDRIPEWAILVEGSDLDAILQAVTTSLIPGLESFSATGVKPTVETYRLLTLNQRLAEEDKA